MIMRTRRAIIFCTGLLAIIACGQGKLDNIQTDSDALAIINTDAQATQKAIADALPIVYMTRADFLSNVTNNRRLVFQYRVAPGNQLTLNGWSSLNNGNDRFNTAPTIELKTGSPSATTFKEGDYLGDFVIQPNLVSDLRSYLSTSPGNTYEYVWMVPERTGNEINYHFYVEKDAPVNLALQTGQTKITAVNTGFEANPSPPRNFN